MVSFCSCFFFQAEDGIRDLTVTGVQTCALPICSMSAASYGIDYCWGGYRMKQQTYRRFAVGDTRAAFFYTTGQTDSVSDRGDFTKIGRGSCRERGEISGVAVSLKKKK